MQRFFFDRDLQRIENARNHRVEARRQRQFDDFAGTEMLGELAKDLVGNVTMHHGFG
jgi:hypothetical protein